MEKRKPQSASGHCIIYYNGEISSSFKYDRRSTRKRIIDDAIKRAQRLNGRVEIIIIPNIR